jgi:DNA polymerase III delta subunit
MLTAYHGSDAYRMRRAVVVSGAEIIDGSTGNAAEQFERALKYPSFFDEHRSVLIHNAATPDILELLKNYSVATLKDITVIALQDTSTPSAYDKKALVKILALASAHETFEALTGNARTAWIRAQCTELGASIEPAAVTALARYTNNSCALANELEKLAAHAQSGTITESDVQMLVLFPIERDTWELSNALAAFDKRTAITTLWHRLREGMPEQLAIGSLAAGLRSLLMVKDLVDRHAPPGAIAKMTGLHPFVVSKTLRGAAAADRTRLKKAHLALATLDRAAKDGRADATDGMFSVLMTL